MKGFGSIDGAQRLPSAFSTISPHFRPHRCLIGACDHRAETTIRCAIWDQITGVSGLPTDA
jgi:putative transposase